MSRTAISANKVVLGHPRHRPWGASPTLDPANVGADSGPAVNSVHASSAATATNGTFNRRWQRSPEPASPSGTVACGIMPTGRRHTPTGRPPSHATQGSKTPSEIRHPTALDPVSHFHTAQPGKVWGGHSTVKEPPSAPQRMGAANARPRDPRPRHRGSSRRSPPLLPAPEG